MTNQSGDNETIRARRRRQGASSGPQTNERAETQRRQRPGSASRPPSGGGGGGSFGGGGTGGGGTGGLKLPVWAIILLVIAFFAYQLFFSGDDATLDEQPGDFEAFPTQSVDEDFEQPAAAVSTPTRVPARPRPTTDPADPGGGVTEGQTWTVLLYQDADDQILEEDIYIDLNEVERVGSTDRVNIVAQVDRYRGGYSGDGNWTGTRRYYITQDEDLQTVGSELVDEVGEANMADGDTLVDFVTWAAQEYPADKYVLILSDHGMGWPGGWSDPDPASRDASGVPLSQALEDDNLYLVELDNALAESVQQAGIDRFEVIGMDACLMGHVEVLSALEPYARYAVLSQETEPALGWAYTSFLQDLVDNPDVTGAEVSTRIVETYIWDDQRIVDNQARAEYLRQGQPLGGLFGGGAQVSAASLARQLERGITLTAVDLAAVPELVESLNALSYALQSEDQEVIASARTYAPSFTNIFGSDTPSPYIDLGGFAQMLKRQGAGGQASQAADGVIAAIQNAVVAEKHGSGKSGATGVSIYFPNSTLYRSAVAGMKSYTSTAPRFAETSLWDNFLVYFYNDVGFERQPAQRIAPSFDQPSRSPGLGQIQVSPIERSAQTAAPNDPVTLTTTITGRNIGYIYLFVGLYDQSANSILKVDTDFLESANTEEMNGVFYPVWSENQSFNLSFDWEPTLFQLSDGQTNVVALFEPLSYGASAEEAVYVVEGVYTYTNGERRSAQLHFVNGELQQVFGFTDENETGGVREIIPQAGDTFTVVDQWLDLDASGQVASTAEQEGATLTFSDEPFAWREVFAGAGEYIVGVIVQDRDGNRQEVYTTITVR